MEIYLKLFRLMIAMAPNEVLLVVSGSSEIQEITLDPSENDAPDITLQDVIDMLELDIQEDADYVIVEKGSHYRLTNSKRIVTKKHLVAHKWIKAG